MYRIVLLISCSFLIFSCSNKQKVLPYYNTPDFTPLFIKNDKEVEQKVIHTIANFSFLNQNNQYINQQNVEGKIHVANFFFTSCGSICPKMTNHMKLVQKAFLNDTTIQLLSYTVTPWIDSVQKLKVYAEANEIKATNWQLLTGSKAAIYELARQSYFAEEDLGFTKDSTEFLHTEHFILVDKTKRIRGIYNGTLLLEIQQLVKDIQLLKQED